MFVIKEFARDESGSSAIEYGLIATLIVVAVIGGMTALGSATNSMYDTIRTTIIAAI